MKEKEDRDSSVPARGQMPTQRINCFLFKIIDWPYIFSERFQGYLRKQIKDSSLWQGVSFFLIIMGSHGKFDLTFDFLFCRKWIVRYQESVQKEKSEIFEIM